MLDESKEHILDYIKSYQERKDNKKRRLKNLRDIIEEKSKQSFSIVINESQKLENPIDTLQVEEFCPRRSSVRAIGCSGRVEKKDDFIDKYLQACEKVGKMEITNDGKIRRRFDIYDLYSGVLHVKKKGRKKSFNKG